MPPARYIALCSTSAPTPIPGVVPPTPPEPGGSIVTANSDTILLSGNGTTGSPLTANLVLQPEGLAESVQLVSTSYGGLSAGENQMVYSVPETLHFQLNFEGSTGVVLPALTAGFDVLVDDVSVGSIQITAGVFTFGGDALSVAVDSVIKIVSSSELAFDYLSISMLGLIDVNFTELGA
jgi:hypothetical protein